MSRSSLPAVLAAEWIKIRSVRSTPWTLALAFVTTVGLSVAFGFAVRDLMASDPVDNYDPVATGLSGLLYTQVVLVVFGVLVVSTEYTTGMIRASLTAVPSRGLFYGCKVLAGTLAALAVSVVTVFVTFFAGEAAIGSRYNASIQDPGALRAVLGTCAYLTLLTAFSMGVAAMLRSSTLSLGILIPLFFALSRLIGKIPGLLTVTRYLPDQAGLRVMAVVPQGPGPGPVAGLLVLLAWTVAALLGGYLVLVRRDA
ncbi:ABC transporter permease [Streptomyces sp. NPDC026672]|uniref:ABC transporter permease n=1 Tax=unclassified Streptomyces TaxID=2593676 RepID=UPI0033F54409